MANKTSNPQSRDKFTMTNWGKIIRECREESGMSQEEAANAAGLSLTWLGSVERGKKRNPTVLRLERILDVYGYDLEAIQR